MNNLLTKISTSRLISNLWIISLILYVASMFFPTFNAPDHIGWFVTLVGFFTFFYDFCDGRIIPFMAWASNYAIIFSLIIAKTRKFKEIVWPIIMTVFTIFAMLFPCCTITINEAGHVEPITALYAGYYLWTASQILMSVTLWLRYVSNRQTPAQLDSAAQ